MTGDRRNPRGVALLCTFNVDLIRGPLSDALAARNVPADLYLSGYGQWESDLHNPSSELYRFAPQVVVVYPDIRDIVPGFSSRVPKADEAAAEGTQAANAVGLAMETFLKRSRDATVLCTGLTVPPSQPLGLLEGNGGYSWQAAASAFNQHIQTLSRSLGRLFFLDMAPLIQRVGWARWEDSRLWPVGRMRLGRDAYPVLAAFLARAVRATLEPRRKCLVLDLDNTLWGGVVGEDGLEGIQLGHSGPGLAFLEFQKALKALPAKGVLLAVCSKNNPADARAVFRSHPSCVLKEADFTAMAIGWDDKATGLRRIAEQIGIGLDSLVFWDDSPVERALVRSMLPDVLVPEIPEDPAAYAEFLHGLEAFDTLTLTREDVRRSAMYREEAQRRRVAADMAGEPPEAFYRSCRIEAVVKRADAFLRPRLSQMVLKTNQFNFSSARYTTAEISAFMNDPDVDVYALEVSDRFGDLGVVGMAIVRRDRTPWCLDTFLLSCRALGRTIEHAFLGFLSSRAKAAGAGLQARYIPTERNAPVKRFLDDLGLEPVRQDDESFLVAIPGDRVAVPPWITLTFEA